jgi:hypothetical protein
MPSLRVGPVAIGPRAARRFAVAGSVAALVGGLWLGVATAADPVESGGPAPAPPAAPPGTAAPAARLPRALEWLLGRNPPRKPLHTVIGAWLRDGTRSRATSEQRVLVGRLVQLGPSAAIVRVGPGQFREVRVTPQTARPARRPEPGDPVLVIGTAAADGTFTARAVLSRPARNALSRSAPLDTDRSRAIR